DWSIGSASRTSSIRWCSMPSKQFTPTTYGSCRSSKKSMDANASAKRRVSTSTTAPMAPRTRSSHMNQNRCWPGVPNRYRIRSLSRETRPKSMATVVVTLFGVAERSSTSTLASVMTASVVSGTISDTEPTKVVFPTPKPPAPTILADVVGCGAAAPRALRGLEPAETTEHPFHEFDRRPVTHDHAALMDQDEPHASHISDQHSGHAERQPQVRGHLRHRSGVQAQPTDRAVLGPDRRIRQPAPLAGGHQCRDGQVVAGAGPPAGLGVRANHRPGLGRAAVLNLTGAVHSRAVGRLHRRPGQHGRDLLAVPVGLRRDARVAVQG